MIKATIGEAALAYKALRNIGEQKLKGKAAWRVARLQGKMKDAIVAYEETQKKLFLDHGGKESDKGVTLSMDPRKEEESDADFSAREKEFAEKMTALNHELVALSKQTVEIDYDPIPLEILEEADLSPNDLADMGPFMKE